MTNSGKVISSSLGTVRRLFYNSSHHKHRMVNESLSNYNKSDYTSIDRRTLLSCKVLKDFMKFTAQSTWTAFTAPDDSIVLYVYSYPDLRDRLLELKERLTDSLDVPGFFLQFRHSVFGRDAFGRSFCCQSDILRS